MNWFLRKQDNSGACWYCGQAISDLACGNCGHCENGKRTDRKKKEPKTEKQRIAELKSNNKDLLAACEQKQEIIESFDVVNEAWGKYVEKIKDENKRLREALMDALECIEGAAGGHGVNFYAYAKDIKALLEGE